MKKKVAGNHLTRKVSMPEPSIGDCARCNESGLLGNGICTTCWDRGRDSEKKVSRLYAYMDDEN